MTDTTAVTTCDKIPCDAGRAAAGATVAVGSGGRAALPPGLLRRCIQTTVLVR